MQAFARVPACPADADDLLWIREGFLDWDGPLLPEQPQTAVVHGHTPRERPTVARHRIGIDTGAVNGGALTCAVLEGRTVRFLAGLRLTRQCPSTSIMS